MNAGVNASSPSVQQIVRDAHTAVAALKAVWPESNMTVGMSGWMLGPVDKPYYFDEVLPAEVAITSLDPNVGWNPVDPGWANVTAAGRSKVLIPWAEDDPGLAGPELWVERMLDHAAKGVGYGVNGLLAVHWRTSELVPEFAAMRSAAWDPKETATARAVYSDFCQAHFGEEVRDEMTDIFLGLDSFAAGVNLSATEFPSTPTKLPRVSQSCCGKFGPCFDMPSGPSHGLCKADACNAFLPNATCPAVGFEFVTAIQAVAPKVQGAANRARFAVWQKSFEYFSQLVSVEAAATHLSEATTNASRLPGNATIVERRAALAHALPLLEALSRAWERMTTSLQQTVLSAGTLGTLATNDANMFVRNFPFNATVAMLHAAGMSVPPSALPSQSYLGPPRLFVRTVRTTLLKEERTLELTATLLSQSYAAVEVWLHSRAMSATPGPWGRVSMQRVAAGRGLFTHVLTVPQGDFEWYTTATVTAAAGDVTDLVFPPGWTDEKETVTVVVL